MIKTDTESSFCVEIEFCNFKFSFINKTIKQQEIRTICIWILCRIAQ